MTSKIIFYFIYICIVNLIKIKLNRFSNTNNLALRNNYNCYSSKFAIKKRTPKQKSLD